MKNKKWAVLFALVVLVALAFTACEGPVGPQGADGATGAAGQDGNDGADGTIFVWKGTYADETAFTVANGIPQNGWAYYDEALKQSRIYNEGAWDTLAEQGEQGDTPYIGDNGNWWIGGVDTGIIVDGVISVSAPTRTGYSQYESFSSAGMVVRVHFIDGTVAIIESGYSLYWNNTLLVDGNYAITTETGGKTITVQWRNKSTSFDIKVFEPSENLQVFDESSWNFALNTIINGGNDQSYVIEVLDDIGVAGSTSNTFGNVSNVLVRLIGEGKLYLTSQGSIFFIGNDQTLIIDSDDLTLEGLTNGQNGSATDNNNSVMYVSNSTSILELRNGTISGNTNTNFGGGVNVNSGSFTMNGGSIRSNISKNPTNSWTYGGGVYISLSGSFTKTGGIIYGNDSEDENNNITFGNTYGHAVQYNGYEGYYCDTTLGEDDDLSTSDELPTTSGETLNGWTRQ